MSDKQPDNSMSLPHVSVSDTVTVTVDTDQRQSMAEVPTTDASPRAGEPNEVTPQLPGATIPTEEVQNPVETSAIASIATAYGDDSSDGEEKKECVVREPRPIDSIHAHGEVTVSTKPPWKSETDIEMLDQEGQSMDSQAETCDGCGSQTQKLHETAMSTEVAGGCGESTAPASIMIPNTTFSFETAHRSASTGPESDEESSDSDSSSATSVSSGLEEMRQQLQEEEEDGFKGPVKTRGELSLRDLPPIQELSITVSENEKMLFLGTVSCIIEELVVVETDGKMPALDQDSILFLEDRVPMGPVFEIFGPVAQPLYSIRFNSASEIETKGITKGSRVYFTPERGDLLHLVNVTELKKLKGSDASWENNNEPPPKFLDYSDDEEEKMARRKKRGEDPSNKGQSAQVAGKRANRQQGKMSPSSSESDGSARDKTQSFSGPHWPPRQPNPRHGSSQPRFSGPPQPRQPHSRPRAAMGCQPWQGSFQPRNPPGPRFPSSQFQPPPLPGNGPPHHHVGPYRGYSSDPNQQWRFQGQPQFPGMPGNQFTFQGQNAFAAPVQWSSPGSAGHQPQAFRPAFNPPTFMHPHYPGYPPY